MIVDSIPGKCRDIINNVPRLSSVGDVVYYCDHRFDGQDAKKGDVAGIDVPLGARVIKAVKDFEALLELRDDKVKAFKELSERTGWYDPRVLEGINEYYHVSSAPKKDAAPRNVKKSVMIGELKPFYKILKDVYTKDGVLLVSSGQGLTQALLTRIQNYHQLIGVKEPVFVEVPGLDPGNSSDEDS